MNQLKFSLKALLYISIASSILLAACNSNNSKTAEVSTVITDTSSPIIIDTSNYINKMDSTNSVGNASMDSMNPANKKVVKTGMAKPDPSKKGRKGKVTIAEMQNSKMKADATPDASGAYKNVDYIPSFPGGNKGLQKYFDDNLEYPLDAQDQGVEGTVRIGFTVDENGKLMNPIVEGANEGYGLDEEALRVIKKMPVWLPGKINGKPVKTRFTLPVKFVLN